MKDKLLYTVLPIALGLALLVGGMWHAATLVEQHEAPPVCELPTMPPVTHTFRF